MIRKDIALDTDRPHYYSQYWIDVALGRHTGTASEVAEADTDTDIEPEDEFKEPEAEIPEVLVPRPARVAKPKAEPKKPEPPRSSVTSLQDLAQMMKTSAEMDSDTVPDIESAVNAPDQVEDVIVTDFDPATITEEVEEPVDGAEAEFSDDEFDEDDEWGSDDEPRRGSKPAKRQRREQRRDF